MIILEHLWPKMHIYLLLHAYHSTIILSQNCHYHANYIVLDMLTQQSNFLTDLYVFINYREIF